MRLLQCMSLLIVCDTQSRGINLAYAQPTRRSNLPRRGEDPLRFLRSP